MFRIIAALMAGLLIVLPVPVAALDLKIATVAPDGTSWMQQMRQGAAEIERRTGGRVRFVFYPGGVMGNENIVLRKIRFGQLHGGAFTAGALAEIYRDVQIYSLPFVFHAYEEVDYVRGRMDPVLLRELERHGFVSFGLSEGGFAYLMSTAPIRRVEDLNGQKVWIPEGDVISRVGFETAGISPISLPLTDVLTGLSTGLIDTIGSSPVGAIALQWHTRVKYLTDTPLFYLFGSLVVEARALGKASAGDQAVVREVMGQVFARINRQTREDNRQARRALERQGIVFIDPSPEEERRWRTIGAEALERLARQGVYSRAMLKTLEGHLNDYRRLSRR